jgi:hypothetical protein
MRIFVSILREGLRTDESERGMTTRLCPCHATLPITYHERTTLTAVCRDRWTKRVLKDYRNADWQRFKEYVSSRIPWHDCKTAPDAAVKKLDMLLSRAVSMFVPCRSERTSKSSARLWDEECASAFQSLQSSSISRHYYNCIISSKLRAFKTRLASRIRLTTRREARPWAALKRASGLGKQVHRIPAIRTASGLMSSSVDTKHKSLMITSLSASLRGARLQAISVIFRQRQQLQISASLLKWSAQRFASWTPVKHVVLPGLLLLCIKSVVMF